MKTFTVTLLFLVALIIEIHGHTDESGRPICCDKLPHQSNPLLRTKREIAEQSDEPQKKQICEPGSVTEVDCNTCRCSPDGALLACTKMACPKIPAEFLNPDGSLKLPHQSNPLLRTKREIAEQSDEPQKKQICEPGSVTEVDCNTCRCSSDGTLLGCTRMACPKIPAEFLNPDGSLKLPHQSNPLLRTKREIAEQSDEPQKKQICEPGSRTKVDCNTCTCSLDGTALGCTRMACPRIPAELLNPDGSLKLPHQSNPLLRAKRSNHYIRYEPINIRRQRDAPFRCVPGSTWKDDCNICFCSTDGRNAGCTLMGCPPKESLRSEPNVDPVNA